LGHTFGHAIEKTAGYGNYLHGEAVATGMVMASRLSAKLGYSDCCSRVKTLLQKNALPVDINYKVSEENFIEAITHDKKNTGGNLRFVLIEKIGASKTANVSKDIVAEVVREFLA
jgi:3-dehydroquinate synthase